MSQRKPWTLMTLVVMITTLGEVGSAPAATCSVSAGVVIDGRTIQGTPQRDVIDCTMSDLGYVIETHGGDDDVQGSKGDDTIRGGAGDDALGGDDCCLQIADGGDDTVFGGEGSDTTYGGYGDDYLDGGPGNDHVAGEIGNDTMVGGPGNDWIGGHLAPAPHYPSTEADFDTADFSGAIGPIKVDLMFEYNGTATGEGRDHVWAIDQVIGSAFGDTINGSDRVERFVGSEGNDTITARGADDHLDGGLGVDKLNGGRGRDSCAAGERVTACET